MGRAGSRGNSYCQGSGDIVVILITLPTEMMSLAIMFLTCAVYVHARDVNILLIVADDLGYNDLGSYGSPTIETPNIDRIGTSGARFTQFYVSAPLCTPSRASMLTGRLPIRSGIYTQFDYPVDSIFRVFYPTSVGCLPQEEVTIGDVLKPDYSTLMVGKWHLGHNKDEHCLPGDGNQGFDFFYGLPYSHEEGYPGPLPEGVVFPPVPLMASGYRFIEQPFNESDLTSRYTSLMENVIMKFAEGQSKIKSSEVALPTSSVDEEIKESFGSLDFSKPFFLHLGYENPHVPLFLSVDYEGQSRRGFFGDSVQEMDMSIGRIYEALEKGNLLDDTLIVFTSDNGAWVNPSNGLNSGRPVKGMGPYDGGSNAPFYEGKGSTWEGGFRVPLLMSWPRMIPSGRTIRAPVTAMDLYPTILDFAGYSEPDGVTLDGVSLKELLTSTDAVPDPHECIYLWREHALYAIRCGPYKAHFITRSGFDFSDPGTVHDPPLLFNVEWDPGEVKPLNTSQPQYAVIAKELSLAANAHVENIVPYPSVYLAQNLSRVPCCPRGGGDYEWAAELKEGPWRDCICARIANN